MEFIYRLENKDGQGCYRNKSAKIDYILCRHFEEEEYYPIPKQDLGIERNPLPNEICGFKDIKQAKNWFNDYELKELKKLGYELKKVEVKKITAIGEMQVLAIK